MIMMDYLFSELLLLIQIKGGCINNCLEMHIYPHILFAKIFFYSFCRLTTLFAVEVYGALPEVDLGLIGIVLLTCVLTVFLILLVSYIHLRNIMYISNKEFEFVNDDDSD